MKHLLLAAALLPFSAAAVAQDATADDTPDLRVRVGVGAQTRPTFIAAYADRSSGVPEIDNRT